jgi:hypothetical protein
MLTLPIMLPDSGVYTNYAKAILANPSLLQQAAIDDGTVYRMPLYAFLIALGDILCGRDKGLGFVVVLQVLLLLASSVSLWRLMGSLNFTIKSKIFVLISYLTGLPLFYAFCVLTDSLFTSLGVIALCSLSRYFLENHKKSHLILFSISSFLMALEKETGLFFALTLLSFTLPALFNYQIKQFVKYCLVILLPTLVGQNLIKSWNYYRTNEYILTTGLSTALIPPQLEFINTFPAYREEIRLFHYLPQKPDLEYMDGVQAVADWKKAENLTTLQVTELQKRDFYKIFYKYPLQKLRLFRKEIVCSFTLFNPALTLRDYYRSALNIKMPSMTLLLRQKQRLSDYDTPEAVWVVFFSLMFTFVSIGLLMRGVWIVYNRAMRGTKDFRNLIYPSLFLQSMGWIIIYSLVHQEPRYTLSSLPILTLVGVSPAFKRKKGDRFNENAMPYTQLS